MHDTKESTASLHCNGQVCSSQQAFLLLQAFVCHIGFVADGQPYVIPTGFARDNEQLYFHGSVGSRMLRALSSGGGDTCSATQLPCCDIGTWHRAFKLHTDVSHDPQAIKDLLAIMLKMCVRLRRCLRDSHPAGWAGLGKVPIQHRHGARTPDSIRLSPCFQV